MIQRSRQFDLGLDRSRIKDSRDKRRQEATVDALLQRLFNSRAHRRWEIQILADEVGMGKTFVALGTAFSVLEAMQNDTAVDDLAGCYQKVLIVTPNNSALFAKWRREVGEFVKRCVLPQFRSQASRWFAAVSVDRIDELARELRRTGSGPRVIVATMGIFAGGRLNDYRLKRRHLLNALFRYWGPAFKGDNRSRLLKGAPLGWPSDPHSLGDFSEEERNLLVFSEDEFMAGLTHIDRPDGCVQKLLETCKEIAAPYVRERDERFKQVENQLVQVYRELSVQLIKQALPLVVVDEAHNWKNGPSMGSNGYDSFVNSIACRSRRALLLTATPFQLRPDEMLEILKVGDHLRTCTTEADSISRRKRLVLHRETVRPILANAAKTSRRFAIAWAKIPRTTARETIEIAWNSTPIVEARSDLAAIARRKGPIATDEIKRVIDAGLTDVDPDIRQLLREGLHLFVINADLSNELGTIVIRHRRHTEHRHFRVGSEYQSTVNGFNNRPDHHVLHAAPGLDVRGDGELPHYLLMRCVSEMKGGKGRSSLGSALTGCYSTLTHSAEGKAVKKRLTEASVGKVYLDLLMSLVGVRQDPKHPKVQQVVESVLNNWSSGEKTLIFCFRMNTAVRLHEIIDHRIRKELKNRRNRCMGGPESLKALQSRLTGRDRDLIVLGLDRLLWSVLWIDEFSELSSRPMVPDDLELMDHELSDLAKIGLRYRKDLLAERIDRIFLHRATEHLIANRLIRDIAPQGILKRVLKDMAQDDWISGPYGLTPQSDEAKGETDAAHFDERGVHSIYDEVSEPDLAEVEQVAKELMERRLRARKQGQVSVLDVYDRGPSLWLGQIPRDLWTCRATNAGLAKTFREIHSHLWGLSLDGDEIDWQSRLLIFQAIRRAVFRKSVLLRLLPDKRERDESGWGELLVQKYFDRLPNQQESMADRIAAFLEDILAASGHVSEEGTARNALYDATKLRDQQFVALVSGTSDSQSRERVFSGFNSPLLPEVLICTSVGQEGIDLHRHCRHVVHFDLAWNPAVLEQRTGRADRIGSKTFRERALAGGTADSFLEIGVPYLAGTYDERMYEELRLRAQTFEVLTGGDLSADQAEGNDDHKTAEGKESGLRFVPLPESMIDAMRVNLHVWSE